MAWESRGGTRFFYSSRRRGKTVEKVYHGKGDLGELAAGLIDRSRRKQVEQRKALASEQARLASVVWAMTQGQRT
jgi:signal transduction histidine kinase